jgi:hypothetical protein
MEEICRSVFPRILHDFGAGQGAEESVVEAVTLQNGNCWWKLRGAGIGRSVESRADRIGERRDRNGCQRQSYDKQSELDRVCRPMTQANMSKIGCVGRCEDYGVMIGDTALRRILRVSDKSLRSAPHGRKPSSPVFLCRCAPSTTRNLPCLRYECQNAPGPKSVYTTRPPVRPD